MKVYVITKLTISNESERIIGIYSEGNKEYAKREVDRLNLEVQFDEDIEYELNSYPVDEEDWL